MDLAVMAMKGYSVFLHHHNIVQLAQISLTLSRHFSLSFIASGRSSGLHPVSSHSCCMYVLAGRPAFARPYVGVHRSTSLMSSSLLLPLCPACLVSSITAASPSDCLESVQDTHLGSLTPLQRWSRCILQPQPTGHKN